MSRLLRVAACANRFIHNTRTKEKQRDWLNDKELKKARKQWILHLQFETRKCIINKSSSKDNINSFGLQLDEDGIIRCHERFTNAINMPEETKKPIYLPKKALDNNVDQRISRAIISRRNLTHIIPDDIYLLDPTSTSYSQSCNISMWRMQKVQWWTIQDAKTSRLAQTKNQ